MIAWADEGAVFTAGYEGRTLEQFIDSLRREKIQLLVDVREAPISRKRGFAKTALSQALAAVDIDYVHLRALGCPKPIRDRHKQDGDWARYTRDYLDHLSRQQSTLHELARLTQARVTVLLCYEEDFNRCHRTYVAQAIAQRTGASVAHIAGAGLVAG